MICEDFADSILSSATLQFRFQGMVGFKACLVAQEGYVWNGSITSDSMTMPVSGSKFVRLEVRNATDSMVALTNPIFMENNVAGS